MTLIEVNERLTFIQQQLAELTTQVARTSTQLAMLLSTQRYKGGKRVVEMPKQAANGRKGKHVGEWDA